MSQEIDASTSAFVDDVAKRIAGTTVAVIVRKSRHVSGSLARVAADAGLAVNDDKMEAVVSALFGAGALLKSFKKSMKTKGSTAIGNFEQAALYLDPLLNQYLNFFAERHNRVATADRALSAMRHFWSAGTQKEVKLLIFPAVVLSVLSSGVLVSVLAAQDLFVKFLIETLQSYYERAMTLSASEDRIRALGCPHRHGWNLFVKFLIEKLQGSPVLVQINKYSASHEAQGFGLASYQPVVKVFKVAKAFVRGKVKLLLVITHGSPSMDVCLTFCRMLTLVSSCWLLLGTAPPGYFVQSLL